MNNDREKLVELLKTNACPSPFMCDPTCRYYGYGDCFPDRFADHLIANGVTVQKRGRWVDVPWVYFGAKQYMCDQCSDDEFWTDRIVNYKENFCPNCGAKMDLPEPPKEE